MVSDRNNSNKDFVKTFWYLTESIIDINIPDEETRAQMLDKGENGVPVNKTEAVRYYKMAIDQGYEYAMNNNADMLRNGDGITVDKVQVVHNNRLIIYSKALVDESQLTSSIGSEKSWSRLRTISRLLNDSLIASVGAYFGVMLHK